MRKRMVSAGVSSAQPERREDNEVEGAEEMGESDVVVEEEEEEEEEEVEINPRSGS